MPPQQSVAFRSIAMPKSDKHLNELRSMPCSLCGAQGPSEAHHVRQGQGMGQRASDFLAIPLCPDCHRGPKGRHGDQQLFRLYKVTEMDLLARTVQRVLQANSKPR